MPTGRKPPLTLKNSNSSTPQMSGEMSGEISGEMSGGCLGTRPPYLFVNNKFIILGCMSCACGVQRLGGGEQLVGRTGLYRPTTSLLHWAG